MDWCWLAFTNGRSISEHPLSAQLPRPLANIHYWTVFANRLEQHSLVSFHQKLSGSPETDSISAVADTQVSATHSVGVLLIVLPRISGLAHSWLVR